MPTSDSVIQNDSDAIIIVGTPTWSQDVDKAAASPLSYDNAMYALHFYVIPIPSGLEIVRKMQYNRDSHFHQRIQHLRCPKRQKQPYRSRTLEIPIDDTTSAT